MLIDGVVLGSIDLLQRFGLFGNFYCYFVCFIDKVFLEVFGIWFYGFLLLDKWGKMRL